MKKKKLLLLVVFVFISLFDAYTDEENIYGKTNYKIGEIVVTATKTEQYQSEIGSSTTVITSEKIESNGKMFVEQLLQNVPGINVTKSGGTGSFSQLYLRGGAPGYAMIMIDGIEVKYLMEHDGGFFDFAHLTIENIERIEIIRGPQSTLYGSSAMTGVINIITKKGDGKLKFDASFEGGSHNTLKGIFGLNGSTENVNYSFSASRLSSDGISSASGGSEKDGCRINTILGRLGFKLFEESELNLIFRYTDAETDIDDGSNEDDPNYVSEKKMFSSKIQFDQTLTEKWEYKMSFSYMDAKRNYNDPADSVDTTEDVDSWYKGDSKRFEWQHNIYPFDNDIITCGFDYKKDNGSSYYRSGTSISEDENKSVDNKAYYFQNQLNLPENLFTTIGFRIDDHELFGTETTYKLSTAYIFKHTGTRLKANWGTGFRAPSIYQLYSFYGDLELDPEKSESYDFGFEQIICEDAVSFGLTYFHNDFKQMIGGTFMVPGDWNSYKYANIDESETKGIELELAIKPVKKLTISANYTSLDTENKSTSMELARRPENKINFSVNYWFSDKCNTDLGIIYVGDSWSDNANTQRMDSYTTVDIAALYKLTENFKVFGRIENLFDEEHHDVHGFTSLGKSFYVGIKASF
ncbi:MAG: TonB-dependent receptor [Candidatus Aureabacteria bacterium]|nr:TonB-dependent receptor [Candidatus Auribacterota bacterium]